MDTYTIKEVSEMFHLPSSTLRYYEDLGILAPLRVDTGNYTCFLHLHIKYKGIQAHS